MEEIKVSIVMPSLNVAKYIGQCIESVIYQTLQEIEIICVDAGSTDGTLEILESYAEKDKRISIIRSEKKSYGYQMNLGMDAARGQYMGIVETDDYAEPNMFEELYFSACKDNLDVAKGGYYLYYSVPEEKNIPVPVTSHVFSQKVFCPLTDFMSAREHAEFFNKAPQIWSAIYRLDFLRENSIRFNETPGAAFQDLSFNFKVFSLASRMRLLEGCFLHYRQDNEKSSVNSSKTVYCVADEYNEIDSFLADNPELLRRLKGLKCFVKYNSYMWNYSRLSEPLQKEFIHFASTDFLKEEHLGNLDRRFFTGPKWDTLQWIITNPLEYHTYRRTQEVGEPSALKIHLPIATSFQDKIDRNWRKVKVYSEVYGWRVTSQKALNKIRRKLLE